MRKISIWLRLSIGFMMLLLLLIVSNFISINFNSELRNKLENFYNHPFMVSNSSRSISTVVLDLRHKYIMLYHQTSDEQADRRKQIIADHKSEIDRDFQVIESSYLGDPLDIALAKRKYQDWFTKWETTLQNRVMSNDLPKFQDDQNLKSERADFLDLYRQIGKIQTFASNKAASFNNEAEDILQKTYTFEMLIILLSLFLTLLLGYLLWRSIITPLYKISHVAEKIRDGNLDLRCEEDSKDEIGKLGFTLNRMTDELVNLNKDLEAKVQDRTRKLEQEIARRIETQKAIEYSEKLFRSVFESSMFGVAFWDEKGNITRANDRFLEMLDYNRIEFETNGLNWQKITAGEFYLENIKDVTTKYSQGKKSVIEDKEYIRKDGSRLHVTEGGEIIYSEPLTGISFAIDISQRKANENKLKEYQDKLEERVQERTRELEENINLVEDSREALTFLVEDVNDSRSEVILVNSQLENVNKELEAFSYSVSHDLKAPLRAIDGFSQALKEDFYDDLSEEAREFIDLVRANAKKMGALINDLLEFSRLGRKEINYNEIDMNKLTRTVFEECMILESSRKIQFDCGDLKPVFADRNMIKQVLINLISNALKFTRHNPKANISVNCQTIEDGKMLEYSVSDNGVGFDMRYYDKLFGVFQRLHTDDQFEGTGVGLALIKRIITKHKGSIWAEGEIDKGAVFHFTLPLSNQDDSSDLEPEDIELKNIEILKP